MCALDWCSNPLPSQLRPASRHRWRLERWLPASRCASARRAASPKGVRKSYTRDKTNDAPSTSLVSIVRTSLSMLHAAEIICVDGASVSGVLRATRVHLAGDETAGELRSLRFV